LLHGMAPVIGIVVAAPEGGGRGCATLAGFSASSARLRARQGHAAGLAAI